MAEALGGRGVEDAAVAAPLGFDRETGRAVVGVGGGDEAELVGIESAQRCFQSQPVGESVADHVERRRAVVGRRAFARHLGADALGGWLALGWIIGTSRADRFRLLE